MSENTNIVICQNPKCGKEYIAQKIDDSFCSFECWELVNCQAPQKRVELFDMSGLFIEPQKA